MGRLAAADTIVNHPLEFAKRWYKVDEIYYGISELFECNSKLVPLDVRSVEFAVWLTRQYQLAMVRGAQLAIEEMRTREVKCG